MFERILAFLTEIVGGTLGFAIAILIGAFVALVFWSYWGWFVVPLGLPAIGFFHAWGLIAMSGLVVPFPQIVGGSDERVAYGRQQLFSILLAWPLGFLIHLLS